MTTAWDALPAWMLPPRPSGWEADDLDNAPDLPRHTELIDGALIFMMSPQRSWRARVVARADDRAGRSGSRGIRDRPGNGGQLNEQEPPRADVLAVTVPYDPTVHITSPTGRPRHRSGLDEPPTATGR